MKNLLFLLFFALSTTCFAQNIPQKYSRVKVLLHETDISELTELGLEYDHGIHAKGRYWINEISAREVAILKENKLDFEILIDDLQAWYQHQNSLPIEEVTASRENNNCEEQNLAAQYQTPQNYTYGSMGGYHTYAELLAVLEEMKVKYPNLISEKQTIGEYLTQENRPIYWLKIGSNPTIQEDKPAILYNALHHAREPNSLSQLLFFMWHLLENYETDAEVKYLLDNVELYFIPCINPDGYVFNERIRPEGGGFWRKNRWVNPMGDTVGVDLNRNYGFNWGLNDQGSSFDPFNETYRGTDAFSEPETQAVRDFCVAHQFKIALNYHAFSNLLIIPWGFENSLTPDDASFRALTKKMIEQNNYTVGTGLETVGYLVNGDSDDWMYGEQETKPKILSITPEVGPGTFGFWPPQTAIDGLNKDCIWQNLTAAALLKPYGAVSETNGLNTIIESSGTLALTLQNIGLESGGFTVSIKSGNASLVVDNNEQSFRLNHLDTANFFINYNILETETLAQDLVFEVIINNGFIERRSFLTKKYYAAPFESAFFDDAETTIANWNTSGEWAITKEQFYSTNSSITDSPSSNYKDETSSFIQTNSLVDLRDAQVATIRFRAKWDLEKGFDFVQIKVSETADNFIPLCGNYTHINGIDQPIYDGTQNEWILEEIDISEYIGKEIFIRFEIASDQFVNRDGFYFDDFSVEVIREVATPISEVSIFADNAVKVQPNPFNNTFEVAFVLTKKASGLTIRLLNILGQEVEVRHLENLTKGAHSFQWENENLENGFYFLQLQSDDNQIITEKLLKEKG